MNKVINGKRYDTGKAEMVGSSDNGLLPGDLDWYGETLYKKRTGEFFLHLEGGARSRVARMDGGSFAPGEAIRPVPYDEARAWAEEHLDADAYAAAFGEPDGGTAAVYLSVSASARSKLDREAAKTGKTRAQIVEELLEAL